MHFAFQTLQHPSKNMYPKSLNPAYTEIFQLENRTIEIPKCVIQFQKWMGTPVNDTIGFPPKVSLTGVPIHF